MTESTLKEDILSALRKERDRLVSLEQATSEDADRLDLCAEFIKRINQSTKEQPATIEVHRPWPQHPLRL